MQSLPSNVASLKVTIAHLNRFSLISRVEIRRLGVSLLLHPKLDKHSLQYLKRNSLRLLARLIA
jgi:hypothetical protein